MKMVLILEVEYFRTNPTAAVHKMIIYSMMPACHSNYYVRRVGTGRENSALLHVKNNITDVTQNIEKKITLGYP